MLSAEGTGNKRITLVELPRIQGGPFHRGPGAHGGRPYPYNRAPNALFVTRDVGIDTSGDYQI